MKITRILCLATVFALPALLPAAPPPISPKALGHAEAIISYCSKVDASSADKYKDWGKKLVAGMSPKALTSARDSEDYKETYAFLIGELEKVPADKAAETCHSAVKEFGK